MSRINVNCDLDINENSCLSHRQKRDKLVRCHDYFLIFPCLCKSWLRLYLDFSQSANMNNYTTVEQLATGAGFTWMEYSSFVTTLLSSIFIGIYYAFFRRNASAERELVGEKMNFLPLTASLIASAASGVTFLGHPSESYAHGIAYSVYLCISHALSGLISIYICLPIVYGLQLKNLYEYFDRRFDQRVRKLTIVIFVLTQMSYAAITSYPPAVVINQFSGFSVNQITIGMMAFCTLYTLLGGFKGVVIIDTIQAAVMILTVVIIMPFGCSRAGGFDNIWSIARDTGRLTDFTFNPDPTIRLSFWSVAIGNALSVTTHLSMNQTMYQRYVSLKSFKQAKWACVVLVASLNGFTILMAIIGLQAYATYYGCDPKSANLVKTYPNTIVYWINDVGLHVKGLRGIFIAGIISASMSTISTNINSVAGVLFLEFIKNQYSAMSDGFSQFVSRILVIGVGIASAAIILAIKDGGSIVELFSCFTSAGGGLVVGLFALGMLTISANATGAFWGGLISLATISLVAIGSRVYIMQGLVPNYPEKIMRTDLCPNGSVINQANWIHTNQTAPYVLPLFKISSFYYGPIAVALTVAFGLAVSHLTPSDENEKQINPELIYKPLRKYLKRYNKPSGIENGEAQVPLKENNLNESYEVKPVDSL